MAIRIVRLGTSRAPDEVLRLGTVRRPPRGVKKEDVARRNFYDTWLPELAPSQALLTWALSEPWTDLRWEMYAERYLAEMQQPPAPRLIALLAAFSQNASFSIGCYCEDESRCHRSLLRGLLAGANAKLIS
jgi:uncharacterized protein YeaO (DUF488 family)